MNNWWPGGRSLVLMGVRRVPLRPGPRSVACRRASRGVRAVPDRGASAPSAPRTRVTVRQVFTRNGNLPLTEARPGRLRRRTAATIARLAARMQESPAAATNGSHSWSSAPRCAPGAPWGRSGTEFAPDVHPTTLLGLEGCGLLPLGAGRCHIPARLRCRGALPGPIRWSGSPLRAEPQPSPASISARVTRRPSRALMTAASTIRWMWSPSARSGFTFSPAATADTNARACVSWWRKTCL